MMNIQLRLSRNNLRFRGEKSARNLKASFGWDFTSPIHVQNLDLNSSLVEPSNDQDAKFNMNINTYTHVPEKSRVRCDRHLRTVSASTALSDLRS